MAPVAAKVVLKAFDVLWNRFGFWCAENAARDAGRLEFHRTVVDKSSLIIFYRRVARVTIFWSTSLMGDFDWSKYFRKINSLESSKGRMIQLLLTDINTA